MVQVTQDDFLGSRLEKGMKKSHRVTPAGYAEEIAPAGREAGIES